MQLRDNGQPVFIDRDINQHFLRPAAKATGIYHPGFGFHVFRREAITALAADGGAAFQAMRTAGHRKADDTARQEAAVRQHQERVLEIQKPAVVSGPNCVTMRQKAS